MVKDADEFVGKSASVIGRAIAARDLDPVEFVSCLLTKINNQNSSIFLSVTAERALTEARAAAIRAREGNTISALDGVPIAWKDLIDMKDTVTTAASALLRRNTPAKEDAHIVKMASSAGMVNLGKLNLTEFAYSGLGLNPHYGTPLNPLSKNVPRCPGGSSAGSGVAVAAGLAPIAIGTDTGGSVRIPAAFNGIIGYKPSEYRISNNGVFALSKTLDTVGPLALTVEDCVLVDATMRGKTSSGVFREKPANISIYVPETVVLEDLEVEVESAFFATLKRLENAGVKVKSGPIPEFAEAAKLAVEIGSITAAEAYYEHESRVEGPQKQSIDRRVVKRIELGKSMTAKDLICLHRARQDFMQKLRARLEGYFLVMPTVAHVAPKIKFLEADDDYFHSMNLKTLRNTAFGNFLNMPGIAMPNGIGSANMPTSILISSFGGQDERLLGACLGLETLVNEGSTRAIRN